MPYRTNDALPPGIKSVLPAHAQDIYRAAFNNAWRQYGGNEATAHRIAWAAVKRSYERVGSIWRKRRTA
jgi:cation transport regulator